MKSHCISFETIYEFLPRRRKMLQQQIETLQAQKRRFEDELADIRVVRRELEAARGVIALIEDRRTLTPNLPEPS